MNTNATSVPVQVRIWLDQNPGFHKSADIAKGLGLETKAVSSALSRLLKQDRVVREDGAYADPNHTDPAEAPEVPETLVSEPEEDLLGAPALEAVPEPESGPEATDEETPFYEYIDFPGNYSIVMAPFAVEIAEAAGVPAKAETSPGKLVRRVFFGGDDVDAAKKVVDLVKEEADNALAALHTWQKENIEKRRGLTDMQKYLQHREVLADHGHKVAKRIRKEGL